MERKNISRSESWGTAAALAVYAVAFIFDTFTPRGFIDWFFYFFPLIFNIPIRQSAILALPLVATPLIVIGLFISPPGVPMEFAVNNRVAAIVILWLLALSVRRRRRIETSLRESENRYRAFFELAGSGAVELDPVTGRFLKANKAFSRIIGYSQQELEKISYEELTFPEDRPHNRATFPRLIRGEIPAYNIEKRYIRKDGRPIWLRISVTAVRDSRGRAQWTVGIIFDIDERKRAEEALKRERSLLQAIFDRVPVMFTIYDPSIKGLRTNAQVERVSGWTEADAAKPDFMSKVYPDPKYRKEIESYMRSLVPGYCDMVMTAKDGTEIATSWANIALPDGRRVGIGLDIRDRKRSEEALRRTEEHLRLALDAGDEGTWDQDLISGSIFLGMNSRKMLGISPDQPVTYETFLNTLHPEDRPRVEHAVEEASSPSSDGRYSSEFRIVLQDGTIRWINARGKVYFTGSGAARRPQRFIGVNRDVTDRRRVEEILRRDKATFERLVEERSDRLLDAQRKLERSNRLSDIGKLAATIAHELRNPLAAIDLATANIARKSQDPSVERSSENIRKKVGESNRIIDDLLFFTRMRQPSFEAVRVYELILDSLNGAKERNHGRNVRVTTDIGGLKDVSLRGDADQLKEVFANLLNNAFEAVPDDREGEVSVSGKAEGVTVEIAVRDNGAGISPENRGKLFEPFFSTKKRGTGLGLSVVSQIVRMHKGTIRVDSEEGKGTAMTITLPVKQ